VRRVPRAGKARFSAVLRAWRSGAKRHDAGRAGYAPGEGARPVRCLGHSGRSTGRVRGTAGGEGAVQCGASGAAVGGLRRASGMARALARLALRIAVALLAPGRLG